MGGMAQTQLGQSSWAGQEPLWPGQVRAEGGLHCTVATPQLLPVGGALGMPKESSMKAPPL